MVEDLTLPQEFLDKDLSLIIKEEISNYGKNTGNITIEEHVGRTVFSTLYNKITMYGRKKLPNMDANEQLLDYLEGIAIDKLMGETDLNSQKLKLTLANAKGELLLIIAREYPTK